MKVYQNNPYHIKEVGIESGVTVETVREEGASIFHVLRQ